MSNNRHISTIFIIALFSIIMFSLAGCSSESSSSGRESNQSDASQENNSEYPITIEHALGETVIASEPERVVTVQWGNQDIALALGVVPVGFSEANFGVEDGSGLLPWTAEKLEELTDEDPNVFQDTDGLDLEAISDAQPDVILAGYSGITEEEYETLSEIAPTVAYPEAPWATTWREQVEWDAKGMGMEEEGEELIQDVEAMIEEKLAEYPEIGGQKVVWVNFSVDDLSQLHIYTPIDSRAALLKEFGLEYPESVTDLIDDPNSYSLELSAENVEALYDADLIVGYGDDDLYQAIQEDSLLGEIPAIKNGAVAMIESDTPLVAAGTPTPLSIEYTIDDYLELLSEAINQQDD